MEKKGGWKEPGRECRKENFYTALARRMKHMVRRDCSPTRTPQIFINLSAVSTAASAVEQCYQPITTTRGAAVVLDTAVAVNTFLYHAAVKQGTWRNASPQGFPSSMT